MCFEISDVYLLDLCIFSYHLHAQTLIWPMDPYYEQMVQSLGDRRERFMAEVRRKTANRSDLHGPGSCQGNQSSGWPSNNTLEPIISKYTRIYPWHPSFTRPTGTTEPWVVYNTPLTITDSINVVKMVRYDTNNGPYPGLKPTLQVDVIHTSRPQNLSNLPKATDLLYCFEGGTGAIGGDNTTQTQHPLWCMMGFVLARTVTDVEMNLSKNVQSPQPASYDMYIVFRGSRSGELRKVEAGVQKRGNPDWVTDWDLFDVIGDHDISERGKVCRGFGTSAKTMLPTVVKAMEEIAAEKKEQPRYIYVTGHSLGAALACHFTSAMLCGTKYGPNGTGNSMPDSLKRWRWKAVKLVTYSSPVVGDKDFHDNFNTTIQSRRIWLDGDFVTQEQVNWLVGEACKISVHDEKTFKTTTVVMGQIYHEPYLMRRNLLISLIKANGSVGTSVAAASGKEHEDEPMKYFQYCADMLFHLEDLQFRRSPNPANISLIGLFPDFSEHVELYLEIFGKCDGDLSVGPEAKAVKFKSLVYNLGKVVASPAATPLQDLESYWQAAKGIQSDEAFFNFIGLCLFLANVSKGFGSAEGLSTFIGQNAKGNYADLLKTKI